LATLVKSGTPSLASALPDASQKITGLLAGEAIAVGDVCYIAAAGTIFRSNGTAATAPAKCDGMAVVAAAIGEAVTLIHDVNVRYGATLTPGARYYVSATAGGPRRRRHHRRHLPGGLRHRRDAHPHYVVAVLDRSLVPSPVSSTSTRTVIAARLSPVVS